MNFTDGIKVPIKGLTNKLYDLTYLSWARALSLSNRVIQNVVTFNEKPYLCFFGGAVVAIDMRNPEKNTTSRVWLPVLDKENLYIPEESLSPRDIHDSIARCKTKSIALNTGVGMSIYGGFDENFAKFLNFIGVTPESDLSQVSVPFHENEITGSQYIEWSHAYTAAKITDTNFHFNVEMFNYGDFRVPFVKVGNGYSVAITVNYKKQEHTEWLPIMDIHGDSIENPTVFDWNTSVMRALTKAIAIVSGYGLAIYANEELNNLLGRKPVQKKNEQKTESEINKPIKELDCSSNVQDGNYLEDLGNLEREEEVVSTKNLVNKDEIENFRVVLKDVGVIESEILAFLEAGVDTLDKITPEVFKQAKNVIDSQY